MKESLSAKLKKLEKRHNQLVTSSQTSEQQEKSERSPTKDGAKLNIISKPACQTKENGDLIFKHDETVCTRGKEHRYIYWANSCELHSQGCVSANVK